MTKYWLNNKSSWGLQLSLLTMILITMVSCNKDFENKLDLSAKKDSITGYRVSKVLYIIIDGARGESVNTVQAPTITEMAYNALQTFNSVSDESGLPATTLTDMVTGVTKAKHKVTTADFAGNNLTNYPMFFKQIKEKSADLRTAAFTSTLSFSQKLISNADVNQNFNNDDAAVKTAMINELKEDNASVVLAEFNSVDRAGQQYGYDASVAQYSSAILTVDGYIKEALSALKQRKNYDKEDWLVIVASNQGGNYTLPPSQVDISLYSKPLLNGFVLFYNPRFAYQFYGRPNVSELPYEGKAIQYTASTIFGSIPVADAAIYNFGTTGEYTVQLKIKLLTRGSNNPPIIAKSDDTGNSAAGWSFLLTTSNSSWRMQLAGSSVSGTALNLNQWYTLTGKLYMEGTARRMKVFTDGVLNNQAAMTANGTSTTAALNVGNSKSAFGGGTAQTIVTDVRIYNTALPDAYIAANYCKAEVKPNDIYYNKLIGYWPSTDGTGKELVDLSPSKRNFTLNGAFSWNAFNDYQPNFCLDLPVDIYKRIPNGVDIPNFIFGWMGIKSLGLNLDSKTWLPLYNSTKP
ncbi:DUF4983 domain-containing protein [Pedobacter frigoris]|uniref:DUF4983 domain-containing protein n=1 Tax=Pedobacter frigoris TaxID=2571272 RepID=A0A4U1CDU4_9SPHI|nr:DUF4983 domain-containing protein [Pedobacter frigoris]TKC05148.1 DUF4983 domain-containing protein [Pedobacter frigoris]